MEEKATNKKQWQERSAAPVAARGMTHLEIDHFRQILIKSYKCNEEDIWYDFEKIKEINDEDRNDCLLLIYRMKCILAGKPTVRDIFTKKLPIPEDLKQKAEELKRQRAQQNPAKVQRPQSQKTQEPKVELAPENDAMPENIPKPRIRKAVKRPGS